MARLARNVLIWVVVLSVIVAVTALVLGLVFGLRGAAKPKVSAPAPAPGPAPTPTPAPAHARVLKNATLQQTVEAAVKTAFKSKPPKNFPIDAVVTWVDGADAAWRKRLAADFAEEKRRFPQVLHGAAREPTPLPDDAHDELYFNMHLAAAHLPWLRTYYVVSQRPHTPKWWPANNRIGNMEVRMVHHDQIVAPPLTTTPSYNSMGIQTWLHNIPGLAEHFILFDDDFFVGRPLSRKDFFKSSGKPVLNMHVMNMGAIPTEQSRQSLWNRICLNIRRMAFAAAGDQKPMLVPPHVCVPCIKSLYGSMITQWFPDEAGAFKRFRAPDTDFVPHYVLLGILALLGHTSPMRSGIITWFHFGGQFAAALREAKLKLPHMFCINDRLSDEERKMLDVEINKLSS